MAEQFKVTEDFQRVGKDGFDAAVRSFGEVGKGLQAIATEWTNHSKNVFEDGTRTFEQLIGAKSFEQAFEIFSLNSPRGLMMPTWPRSRSLERCMLAWPATRSSPSSSSFGQEDGLTSLPKFPSTKDPGPTWVFFLLIVEASPEAVELWDKLTRA